MGKSNLKTSPKVKTASKKATNVKHDKGNSKLQGVKLSSAHEAIMEAMGKLRFIGIGQPTRDFVQTVSGNAKTKAGFEKNLGKLRKDHGLVTYPDSKTVQLTDKGITYVGSQFDPDNATQDDIFDGIKEIIPPKAGEILDKIQDGEVHDRLETAKKLNYDLQKLSGYDKYLSRMSSLQFLKYDKCQLQLTDKCYPKGRPNGTVESI